MKVDFEGKIAWITGASSGLGEALARALAARGASVVLSARREEMLRGVQAACAHPERHYVLPLDLAAPEAAAPAALRVRERYGHVDLLIHNAGLSQRAFAVDTQFSVDQYLLAVNFLGPVALTKQVLPGMIARGSGQLVVISSLLGKFGAAGRSSYSASKHALHGFFDSLRAELAGAGVSVTLVCPGFIATDSSRNALAGNGQPHGKLDDQQWDAASPADCARKIVSAIARRKPEIYLVGPERLAVLGSRIAPGLFRRVMARVRL